MAYLITLWRRPEKETEYGPQTEYAICETIEEGRRTATTHDWRFIGYDEITPAFIERYLREVNEFVSMAIRLQIPNAYTIPQAAYMLIAIREQSPRTYLKSRYYPVNVDQKIIYNQPQKREMDCSWLDNPQYPHGTIGIKGERLNRFKVYQSYITIE